MSHSSIKIRLISVVKSDYIRISKPLRQPHGICCVGATFVLRARPSTMEPQWSQRTTPSTMEPRLSQINYFAIQERQFCLDLLYQDVLPSVSTKKRTRSTSTRKYGTSKPTTQMRRQRPNQRNPNGMTSISCRHHHRRRPRRPHRRKNSSISR